MISRRVDAAFTMIELVVVLAIVAILASVILVSMRQDSQNAAVLSAAQELAGVMTRTRNQAMRDGMTYGVAFNLQNEPGSSGEVLNNRSGGHWYRVIGPAQNKSRAFEFSDRIPYAGDATGSTFGDKSPFFNFPNLLDAVADAWVSEPYVLPPRKVRFLALSDVDEGPRRAYRTPAVSAQTVWYGTGETTYPRPFFGYYDQLTGQLWPWGGYHQGKAYSGFYYQGNSPGWIPDSRNPAPTRTWPYFLVRAATIGSTVWTSKDVLSAGQPRPLVNAAWLDACLVFLPDGRALFQEWNRNRRYYDAIAPASTSLNDMTRRGGVSDMCKSPTTSGIAAGTPSYWGGDLYEEFIDGTCPYDWPEVTHFDKHTGGWFITLAPDVLVDQRSFPTAQEALASMLPMVRVWVGTHGAVKVLPVRRREGAFAGRTLWPPTPDTWLSTTGSSANPIWQRCRMGFLHATETRNPSQSPAFLRPTGQPITDIVNTQMLTQRQWWIDEP
jgi:prepilin-type N-terminal cleavage/methylation domain-containing protein